RYGSGGPLQNLLELGPRPLPRPATTLLEGDERARIDDLELREIPLLDVQFTAPGGDRCASAGYARIAGFGFHPPSVASGSGGRGPTGPSGGRETRVALLRKERYGCGNKPASEGPAMTVMIALPILTDNQIGACTQD